MDQSIINQAHEAADQPHGTADQAHGAVDQAHGPPPTGPLIKPTGPPIKPTRPPISLPDGQLFLNRVLIAALDASGLVCTSKDGSPISDADQRNKRTVVARARMGGVGQWSHTEGVLHLLRAGEALRDTACRVHPCGRPLAASEERSALLADPLSGARLCSRPPSTRPVPARARRRAGRGSPSAEGR